MKQSKFTLANVLLLLATIGFGFACYLSINFKTLGDTQQSLIGAIIISLVLAGLAFAAKKFKSTDRKFKTNIILEIVALLLFIVVAFFAIKPFSHAFTVFKNKDGIENKTIDNISQAQKMFDSYEDYANNRINTYERTLKSVVANKEANPSEYRNYGFDETRRDENQIKTKIFMLRAKLIPSNYKNDSIPKEGIKGKAAIWFEEQKTKVKSDFSFTFGIVAMLNEIPMKIKNWRNRLTEYSEYRAKGETAKDFDYSLDFKTVKEQLTTIKTPTILSVVLAILAYLLMLLPYFVVIRSPKSPYHSIIHFLSSFLIKDKSEEDDDINVKLD